MSKTLRRHLGLIAWAVSCLALALPAGAQTKTPAPAAAPAAPAAAKKLETGKQFEDWSIACEAQADKSQKCFATQNQVVTASGQRLVNINVGYLGPKGEAMVVVFLPLGIDLRAGAAMKFDPGPQLPLNVVACFPAEGCQSTAMLDAVALKALGEAKAITVGVRPFGDERTMNMTISVKGLAAAFAALK